METDINALEESFNQELANATDLRMIDQVKVKYMGKKGALAQYMQQLRSLSNAEKAEAGKQINRLKGIFQGLLQKRVTDVKEFAFREQMENEWIDISIDPQEPEKGGLHPISLIQHKLEEIFVSMGFYVLDGPHIETEYYNFEALNIAEHHPARDLQDTFYFEDGHLLRTQTSTIQIRGMENLEPPLRIVGPGKVFRCERTDASHDSCFHQFEGMMIDKDISVAHLNYFMKTMLSEIFEREVDVRLRPGYFPFVEPGFELDMKCLLCGGEGCKFCKQVGWIELIGCGMVHPNVLRAGKIDPTKYSGFAFGMGIDRLAMMRYEINDIRYLHGGDLQFARTFAI